MSKDFFKVKKGLHIKPSDPSTLTDLEDGDIIVDSTDNQLKKYSEEDGEFATIAGSGGAVANFFSDFDKLTPTLDPLDQVSVADDAVVFLPIDDNKKSKKITYTAAGSALYQVAASADLEGAQGLMTIWIKTDVQGVTVSTTTDEAKQSTLSVLATGKWRQYEIPYVVGGTNQGLIVESANSGDVNIDEPFVGLAPAGYIQDVGQAQFVGSLVYNSPNCQWATTSTTYASFPVDADCNASNITGNVESPDTKIPAIKILNARTDGHYRVEHHGLNYITNQTGACLFSLSSSSSFENKGITYTESSDRTGHQIIGDFRFETGGDKQVQVISYRLGGTGGECAVFGNDIVSSTFSVHFYPDASSTIVSQDTELTAQTANELSARISSGGGITSENYDWIDSCIANSTGDYTCTFKSNVFTVAPSVAIDILSGSGSCRQHRVSGVSTTDFRYQTFSTNGTLADCQIAAFASKQGADVNKSATIVGKFENINSSDLVKVEAAGNNGATISALSAMNFTEINDPTNSWSGSVFTAPKDGNYLFEGAVAFSANSNGRVQMYKNGSAYKVISTSQNDNTTSAYAFSGIAELVQGDTITLVHNQTRALSNNAQFHHLTIQQLPDTESIVKNLLAESSQTKCQTKVLSANVTADITDVADLRFTNLTIGKKYEVKIGAYFNSMVNGQQMHMLTYQGTSTANAFLELRYYHLNATLVNFSAGNSKIVKATEDSIRTRFDFTTNGGTVISGNNTFVQLCQLPDTFVDTEEF